MLEDYYVKPSTIDRVRSSWLAPQIESYLEWLQAHGYSRLVVYRRLPLLFHFSEFAQKKGCRDIASCKPYVKEFASQWLEQHGAKAKTAVAVRKHAIDADCGVRQMLQLACKEPVTRNRRRGAFPFESAVPGFAEYLRGERGFAESTIRNYRRHLSEFAQYLIQTGVTAFSPVVPTSCRIQCCAEARPDLRNRVLGHRTKSVEQSFAAGSKDKGQLESGPGECRTWLKDQCQNRAGTRIHFSGR